MNSRKYKILLVVVSFVGALSIGWKMSTLPLWSHYPLFLFLFLWVGIVALMELRFSETLDSRKALILSSSSGLLLSLAFPPFGLTPLIFIAFIPLFYIHENLKISHSQKLFYTYSGLVFWNIYDTYWVANAALVPGMVAIWLNSLFMLMPWIAALKIGAKWPKLRWWAFIIFWISFEYLHLNWEISWPWLTLGNCWSSLTTWVQWYEYTGVFGGSLWVLLLNVLIFDFFKQTKDYKSTLNQSRIFHWKKLMIIIALILVPVLISYFRYYTFIPEGKYGEVAVIQPNYEPHYEKFKVDEMQQITRLGRLAEMVINQDTRFIVFPETCFGDSGGPVNADKVSSDNRSILFYDFIESHFNIPIVMGVTTVRFTQEGERPSKYARPSNKNTGSYEIGNSAIILKKRIEKVPVYYKSRLVPGPEIFPYRQFLPFLKPIVDKLGGSIYGLAIQQNRAVFESNGYKIAPVICYESIYGDFMRGYVKNGAQAIFVMTNDGWWDDTPGYKQHMAYSKLRAIELRKPVVRSANSGISCFIDSKGDVGQSIPYGVHSAIKQGISFSDDLTFYAVWGDLLAYIALVFGSFLVIYYIFSSIRKNIIPASNI